MEQKNEIHVSEISWFDIEFDSERDELVRKNRVGEQPEIVLFSTTTGRNVFYEKFFQQKKRTW